MSANSRFTIAIHVLTLLHVRRTEAVASSFIAGSVNTNPVVIRRLLADLAAAGLVESSKGISGGYRLARSAESISLADVYRALGEGHLFGMHPSNPNPLCSVGKTIQDKLKPVFESVELALTEQLERQNIANFQP